MGLEQGSDGTIAGKRVEIKTSSPDFSSYLFVRITRDFQFQAKLFERGERTGLTRKFLRGRLQDAGSDLCSQNGAQSIRS